MQPLEAYLQAQHLIIASQSRFAPYVEKFGKLQDSNDVNWNKFSYIPVEIKDQNSETKLKKLREFQVCLNTLAAQERDKELVKQLISYDSQIRQLQTICAGLLSLCDEICDTLSRKHPELREIRKFEENLRDVIKGTTEEIEKQETALIELKIRKRNLTLASNISYKKYKAATLLATSFHPEQTENAYIRHSNGWDILKTIKKYLSYLASGWRNSVIITTGILTILVNFAAETILIIGLSSAVFAFVLAFYGDYKKDRKHIHNKNVSILAKILILDQSQHLATDDPQLDRIKFKLDSTNNCNIQKETARHYSPFKKTWTLLATFLGFTWTAYVIPSAAIYIGILLSKFPATWMVSGIITGSLGIIFVGTALSIGLFAMLIKAYFLYREENQLIASKQRKRNQEYQARKLVNQFYSDKKSICPAEKPPSLHFIRKNLKAISQFFNDPLKKAIRQGLSWAGISFLLSKMLLFGTGFILSFYNISIIPALAISLPIAIIAFICIVPYKYYKHHATKEKMKDSPELTEKNLHELNQILLSKFNLLTPEDKKWLYTYNQERYAMKIKQIELNPTRTGFKNLLIINKKTKYQKGISFFKGLIVNEQTKQSSNITALVN